MKVTIVWHNRFIHVLEKCFDCLVHKVVGDEAHAFEFIGADALIAC